MFYRIHGICVYETVDYYYTECDRYLQELGLTKDTNNNSIGSHDLMELYMCKGLGYSILSTDDEISMLSTIHWHFTPSLPSPPSSIVIILNASHSKLFDCKICM